jgi:hypothetical protein
MNKKVIAGLAVIAVGAGIYFICGTEDSGEKKQSLLLSTESASGKDASPRDEKKSDESGSEDESDQPKASPNTLSFFLGKDRSSYSFQAIGAFRKVSATTEMTGYVGNFAVSPEGINVPDQSKLSNVISILLPGDVSPGTYTEKSSNFMVQYFGQEPGLLFNLDQNCSFTLTITEWGGSGGRVRGTFSGELKSEGAATIISFSEGRFEAGIQ